MKAIMKNKGFITGIMLVVVLIVAFIVRAFYIGTMMNKINVDEQLLKLSMLDRNGVAAADILQVGFLLKQLIYFVCRFLA